MIDISMTSFVDIVQKSGVSKARAVVKVKQQMADEYTPAKDYYKGVRESIVNVHRTGKSKSELPNAEEITTYSAKWPNYQAIVDGYKVFWGRKELVWFNPEVGNWISGDMNVKVNPELGLYINGEPYLIKLYFKKDPVLSKKKAELSLCLMNLILPQEINETQIIHAILDVNRHKVFISEGNNSETERALIGEASYIQAIWGSI